MNPIALADLRRIVGGEFVGGASTDGGPVTSVSIDSRKVAAGALFVAIKGDTHDGHDHVVPAANAGAAAILVDRLPAAPMPRCPILRVADARRAMGALGRHVRQGLGGTVVAVGGSNGKTSTKNLIDSALCRDRRGSISPKSFNNDIGVPTTIFDADPSHDYLVLELGTNHHGEIATLTEIARPDVAVITNVSAEHLEGLGDLDGVRREEATIVRGLKPDGVLIVNGDDAPLLELVSSFRGRRITFGHSHANDLHATNVRCGYDGVRFHVGRDAREWFVPLLGRHTAFNALAAIAVAREMGLGDDRIAAALAAAHGPDMRLQLQEVRGIRVINDAYNANPASMKAALETLGHLPHAGRRVAVLGDMRELGETTDELHEEMGRFVAACPVDRLICVGAKSALIAEHAVFAGMAAERVNHFPTTERAAAEASGMLRDGDLVLLKGSRYMRLERIAAALGAAPARKAS